MEEMYKKIFIKTEADLPKEEGQYFIHTLQGRMFYINLYTIKNYYKEVIDWYLQPCPPQPREVTDEEIYEKIHFERALLLKGKGNMSIGRMQLDELEWMNLYQSVTKWMRSQMKGGTK
jgi:hypothetical protein